MWLIAKRLEKGRFVCKHHLNTTFQRPIRMLECERHGRFVAAWLHLALERAHERGS
jgi:hypothetical protein